MNTSQRRRMGLSAQTGASCLSAGDKIDYYNVGMSFPAFLSLGGAGTINMWFEPGDLSCKRENGTG